MQEKILDISFTPNKEDDEIQLFTFRNVHTYFLFGLYLMFSQWHTPKWDMAKSWY